jgi:hypothetical protein
VLTNADALAVRKQYSKLLLVDGLEEGGHKVITSLGGRQLFSHQHCTTCKIDKLIFGSKGLQIMSELRKYWLSLKIHFNIILPFKLYYLKML